MYEDKKRFCLIIHSYDHDKVIRNPKENIRSLINWLEWGWNEKFLSPQKSKRSIFTAGSAQVSQKINSNS